MSTEPDTDQPAQAAEAEVLAGLAQEAFANGLLERALGLYQQSLLLLEKLGDRLGKGVTLAGMAKIAQEQQDFDMALNLYKESSQEFKRAATANPEKTLARQGQASSISQMATVYWEMQNPEQAQDLLEQAIAISREIHDDEGLAYDITKLGQLSEASGELRLALARYREGLALFEKLGDEKSINELRKMVTTLEGVVPPMPAAEKPQSELARSIGQASRAVERGDTQLAIQHQERVVALARELANPPALIVQLANLAQYYALAERFEEAVTVLDEAIQIGAGIQFAELSTLQQLRRTLASVAALSPAEKAAAKEDLNRAQVAKTAAEARDAALAFLRKQAPKRDVLKLLQEGAKRMHSIESTHTAHLEVAALCEALTALLTDGTVQAVPESYAAHFAVVQAEYNPTNA